MHVLVTCKNEEDPIKHEVTRGAQNLPHYKSMGIFQDAQGQLTPQYSNSSKILCLYTLHVRMEKIRSKVKALGWPQHYTLIFRRSMLANSAVNDGIWLKFELIQALMYVPIYLQE